jgi:hypothetical protein
MKEHIKKEIRKLIRERQDIDTAIAAFESLEAQSRLYALFKKASTTPPLRSGRGKSLQLCGRVSEPRA